MVAPSRGARTGFFLEDRLPQKGSIVSLVYVYFQPLCRRQLRSFAATATRSGACKERLSLCCTSGCEGDFNRIGNISLVETTMNKRTLPLDTLQVFVHIATENLLNLVVVERCSQAADKTFDTS